MSDRSLPAGARVVPIVALVVVSAVVAACDGIERTTTADLLLRSGTVHDGSGREPFVADVAIAGDRITFVGDARAAGISGAEELDVSGLLVAPGFIDMHSHAALDTDYGRDALPFREHDWEQRVCRLHVARQQDIHHRRA